MNCDDLLQAARADVRMYQALKREAEAEVERLRDALTQDGGHPLLDCQAEVERLRAALRELASWDTERGQPAYSGKVYGIARAALEEKP